MSGYVIVIVVAMVLLPLGLSVKVVKQYEQGVLFRLGRVRDVRMPGPSAALLMLKTGLASDHAKIIIRPRKSLPTWAVTQNHRADSDRRDDRIRTCDPPVST